MKVKELIAELQKYDPESEIEVPVQTYTQRYPSGYFELWRVTESWMGIVRLWVSLPKGYVISERKNKQ